MRLLILFILSPLLLCSQTQIGNDIDGIAAGDNSGYSVSISNDGSTIAIGSPGYDGIRNGQVHVFENIGGIWTQIGQEINGENEDDHFGSSVSLSGDGSILAIGAPDNEDTPEIAGHVRVFENISGVWTQIGDDIDGVAGTGGEVFPPQVRFGAYVSISNDGSILAIAEPTGGTWEAGYGNDGFMHIYENVSGVWTQIGDDINTGISFLTDISISRDGSVVAISGSGDCGWPCWIGPIGFVKVYNNISGVWTQIGSTFTGVFDFDFENDNYIRNVSLNDNGSILAIGGSRMNIIYENISDEWMQIGNDIVGSEPNYSYSHNKISLSDDGTVLACSDFGSGASPDLIRIYKNSSGSWTQLGVDIYEETTNDNFGASLELSGDGTTLVVGASNNDDNGIDSGHARVYDLTALLSVEESIILGVNLYPNPATNQFAIRIPGGQSLEKVNIYNNLGQFIETSDTEIIGTSHLTSGLYYVEVIMSNGKATTKLIIN